MIANALSPMNNEQLGVNLMVDYVRWVDRDYADINPNNWRGVLILSPIEIGTPCF
jgi:hypothetical protein